MRKRYSIARGSPTNSNALRGRVNELAEALFQSIGMQLSVEKYQAIDVGRGANLDELDVPLNNRVWLKNRFAELRKLESDAAKLRGIDEIVHWTDPGPGGFYDDLGIHRASRTWSATARMPTIPAFWKRRRSDFAPIFPGDDRGARTWMACTRRP